MMLSPHSRIYGEKRQNDPGLLDVTSDNNALQPFQSLAEVLVPADVLFQTLNGFPLAGKHVLSITTADKKRLRADP